MAIPIRSNVNLYDIFEKLDETASQLKYSDVIDNMVKLNKTSLSLNFEDLLNYDKNLSQNIIENPKLCLQQLRKQVYLYLEKKHFEYTRKIRRVSVRIINLPSLTLLENLGGTLVGKLLKIQGIVTQVSPSRLMVEKAIYRCISCGDQYHGKIGELYQEPPKMCNYCRCRTFRMDEHESIFVDSRWISIQSVEPITKPKIDVLLTGDISDKLSLRKKIGVIGYIEVVKDKESSKDIPLYDYFLIANSIYDIK